MMMDNHHRSRSTKIEQEEVMEHGVILSTQAFVWGGLLLFFIGLGIGMFMNYTRDHEQLTTFQHGNAKVGIFRLEDLQAVVNACLPGAAAVWQKVTSHHDEVLYLATVRAVSHSVRRMNIRSTVDSDFDAKKDYFIASIAGAKAKRQALLMQLKTETNPTKQISLRERLEMTGESLLHLEQGHAKLDVLRAAIDATRKIRQRS